MFAVTLVIMMVALYELKKIYLAMGYNPSLPIMVIGAIILPPRGLSEAAAGLTGSLLYLWW